MNGKVRINLLPPELAGKAGKSKSRGGGVPGQTQMGPNPVVVIIGLVAFAACAFFCYTLWQKTEEQKRIHYDKKLKLENLTVKVEAKREKFREFIQTRDLILSLSEVLDAIDPPNRIIWSEKLIMLADLVPENVFITNIKVIEKERMVLSDESKKAIKEWERGGKVGAKPKEIMKPIIHQELTISALARTGDNQEVFDSILEFLRAMESYKRKRIDGTERYFMENFVGKPSYSEIKATTFDAIGVYQFSVFLKTKPLSAQFTEEDRSDGNE